MGDRFAVTFEPSDEAAPIELHAGGAWSSVDPNELGAEPLLVLGVDERALFMSRIPSFQDPAGSTLPSAAGDKKWYLRMLEIYDDKEPAYKGDPEVFIMCYPTLSTSGYGNIVEGPLDRVNDENHEYWWNDLATQPRLNTLRPGDISRCDIMEADSDSLDDLIETVNFFYSDSNFREYDLGNAHFKVRWAVE
jgi:hypothetical protein